MTLSQVQYNVLHGVFLILNVIGFGWMSYYAPDWHFYVKYFSNQSFELAILYSIFSLLKTTKQSKITQILYELSFTFTIITCSGYWVVVRPYLINLISYNFTLCNDFTHTMPICMLIVIHLVQKLEYFHKENLKYQFYLMTMATIVNVFYTFWDKPVYKFMTYKDIGTGVFLIGGFTVMVLIFLGMGKVSKIRANSLKTE